MLASQSSHVELRLRGSFPEASVFIMSPVHILSLALEISGQVQYKEGERTLDAPSLRKDTIVLCPMQRRSKSFP